MLDFEKARTMRQFCDDVGISRHTAWRQIREGKLRAVRRGARVFISDTAAAAWCEAGRVRPRTEQFAAVEHFASAAGITPKALAAALGRRVPHGVSIAHPTLTAWLAEAWSDLAAGEQP